MVNSMNCWSISSSRLTRRFIHAFRLVLPALMARFVSRYGKFRRVMCNGVNNDKAEKGSITALWKLGYHSKHMSWTLNQSMTCAERNDLVINYVSWATWRWTIAYAVWNTIKSVLTCKVQKLRDGCIECEQQARLIDHTSKTKTLSKKTGTSRTLISTKMSSMFNL